MPCATGAAAPFFSLIAVACTVFVEVISGITAVGKEGIGTHGEQVIGFVAAYPSTPTVAIAKREPGVVDVNAAGGIHQRLKTKACKLMIVCACACGLKHNATSLTKVVTVTVALGVAVAKVTVAKQQVAAIGVAVGVDIELNVAAEY